MREGVRTGEQSVYLALGRQILRSDSPPGGLRSISSHLGVPGMATEMCMLRFACGQRRPEGQRRA